MHIENTLKDKTNSQQKTNELWIVTTIKAITKMPIQKFEMHILSFRRRHEAAVRNSKIFAELKGDLGAEIASQKDSSVNYGPEFRNAAALSQLFLYHEERTKIVNIIQQVSREHLDPINEKTRKHLDAIIIRGNNKSLQSDLNSAALDKSISKEIDYGWALPLTIDSLQNIKNVGVVPLGVAEQFSLNEKEERYIKRRVTHYC